MTGEMLLTSIENSIAAVTLNRPQARNALSAELRRRVRTAIEELDRDEDILAIVLTGTDPAFCAGLDLREAGTLGVDDVLDEDQWAFPQTHSTPMIAAVNGAAVTGGFELALSCDIVVASERALFIDSHARVGLMPGWGLSVRLPELIGLQRAKEMSLTGRPLDAKTAEAWGLVNHVVGHEDLLGFAFDLARDITAGDRQAVSEILGVYNSAARHRQRPAWDLELQTARAWLEHGRGTAADIDQRRSGVIERGQANSRRR